jgi:hypothetical protein
MPPPAQAWALTILTMMIGAGAALLTTNRSLWSHAPASAADLLSFVGTGIRGCNEYAVAFHTA